MHLVSVLVTLPSVGVVVLHPEVLQDYSTTSGIEEVRGVGNLIGVVTVADGVKFGCPNDAACDEVRGATTISTSSSLLLEPLMVVSLTWCSGALAVVEGAPIESPAHGYFAIAFFG